MRDGVACIKSNSMPCRVRNSAWPVRSVQDVPQVRTHPSAYVQRRFL